ncbi:hypothetical protein PINS_up010531 [Pythium insidiosum]|nr:hypothetical protein PINS_up010531 [Pythium insidiosum]
MAKNPQRLAEREVLFFDGTKTVRWPSIHPEHDDDTMTESSSGTNDAATEHAESKWFTAKADLSYLPPSCPSASSWEDLGSVSREISAPDQQDVLKHPVIGILFRPRNSRRRPRLEVYEKDVIEDAVKALCGIESAFFRRRIKTAALALSTACELSFGTSSSSGLRKTLKEFERAGSAFMRLEFISVYFAQDPSRGGKTAQSMALALAQFLSYVQTRYDEKLRDSRTRQSLLALTASTRDLRSLVIRLESVICGTQADQSSFWALLVNDEFPRGIKLLNHLERYVTDIELSDTTGQFSKLLQWILVRTVEPFLSVLTTFLWTGVVPLEADPHHEFSLSVFSTLINQNEARDAFKDNILPRFLECSRDSILHVGRLQQLLSTLIPSSLLRQSTSLQLRHSLTEAERALETTKLDISSIISHVKELYQPVVERTTTTATSHAKSLRNCGDSDATEEEAWRAIKRSRVEATRHQQAQVRETLDAQVKERHELQVREKELEAEAQCSADAQAMCAEQAELERGKELLLEKYGVLLEDADERLQYMQWRRSRACRITAARKELLEVLAQDEENWQAERVLQANACALEETVDVEMQESVVKPSNNTVSSDETSGLLWRPRLRPIRVPGGGGSAAASSLYPTTDAESSISPSRDRFSSIKILRASGGGGEQAARLLYPDPIGSPRPSTSTNPDCLTVEELHTAVGDPDISHRSSSIRTLRPPGGDGASAFNAIYGGEGEASDIVEHFSAVRVVREPGGGGTEAKSIIYGASSAEVPSLRSSNGDVDMEQQDLSNAVLDESSHETADAEEPSLDVTMEPLGIDSDEDAGYGAAESTHEIEAAFSVTELLTTQTNFFHAVVEEKDDQVLREVLDNSNQVVATVPFKLLVQSSILLPIDHMKSELDCVALHAVTNRLNVHSHLAWVHRVMLMSEGLCMTVFARDVLSSMRSPVSRSLVAQPGRLSSMLGLALIETRVVKGTAIPPFDYRVNPDVVSCM